MFRTLFIALLAFLLEAQAAPANSGQSYDDNYDDLGQGSLLGLTQVTKYHGLVYGGWALSTSNPSSLAIGVIPHSLNNAIVAKTPLTTLTGNPGTVSTGDGVKCFDLSSFYYGCALNSQQAQVSTAAGCGINVSGYRQDGKGSKMVGSVALNYDVGPNVLASPMRLADLSKNPDFKCLTNVTISVATGVLALLKIDDLVHVNYKS